MAKMEKLRPYNYVVGIDEAGRGPLAGPVAVGAVSVPQKRLKEFTTRFKGIKDSKKLSAQKREMWFKKLEAARWDGVLDFRVSFSGSGTIDKQGISFAISRSVAATLRMLKCPPEESFILLDGSLHAPAEYIAQKTIIRGDESIMIISLASIAAKVLRDQLMDKFSLEYPNYGFEEHKGYGTTEHFKKIRKYGITEIHRKSFLTKIIPVDK